MKIYDCFMFFDEEMLLDLRLNILDKYVDKFVITEANYMHSGKPKKLLLDINKFGKFKDKIIYKIIDKPPQWLRDIKHKKYSPLRLDILFSKLKYSSICHIKNGGWHFSNIKSPEDIEKKFSNYLHHQEFEYSGLNLDDIKKMLNDKKIIYDLSADQTAFKLAGSKTLKKINLDQMPKYLKENYSKYEKWIEL